jgi:hypothetical protein
VEPEAWFENWPFVGLLMRRKRTAIDYAAVSCSVKNTTIQTKRAGRIQTVVMKSSKGKCKKLTPEQATKAQMGSKSVALLFP